MGGIDFEKIYGDRHWVVDTSYRIDLNDVIPCLPPVCHPVYEFCLIREEAPAAEATEASCTCHML